MRHKKEKIAFPLRASVAVEKNIIQARNLYISHMVEPWDKPIDWIVEKLFPEQVRTACQLGFRYSTDNVKKYNSSEISVLSDVTASIEWKYLERAKMLPPHPDYQFIVGTYIPELVEMCKKIRGILFDYAKVIHVFNWFNTCGATPTAIRNYCPWIRSLLPNEYIPLIDGNRFREPNKLATMLDLIKETSSIMSRALLIQHTLQTPAKQGFSLRFSPVNIRGISVPPYVMEC